MIWKQVQIKREKKFTLIIFILLYAEIKEYLIRNKKIYNFLIKILNILFSPKAFGFSYKKICILFLYMII